ncbi:unnamed protein product [Soboliphyme baturini]|uniref:Uncharacterized protein n=1 Tax=Soboliphyme baturini TaxID=241478 RepID=A0A183J7Q0_9BILA|nr:unnamed protein product [Soboliphyme baturini]
MDERQLQKKCIVHRKYVCTQKLRSAGAGDERKVR